MADHKLQIDDEQQVEESIGTQLPPDDGRKDYKVTADDGLFKNGRLYEKGETIRLDELTASNFMELGEVEAM